jgi:hypothetical protein
LVSETDTLHDIFKIQLTAKNTSPCPLRSLPHEGGQNKNFAPFAVKIFYYFRPDYLELK